MAKNKKPSQQENREEIQPEKAPKFPYLFRRISEFLILCLIISLPLEALRAIKAANSWIWGLRLSFSAFFLYTVINIYLNRVFFFSMGNRKVYIRVNLLAYTIAAVVNILCFSIPSPVYNFVFMPFNYVSYLIKDIMGAGYTADNFRIHSALITHIFMYAVILFSPMEMYSIEKKLTRRKK